MNCQTLDGQNKPTANWDFNGKKITNLGAPSAPTDVARLGDVAGQLNEWQADTRSFSWVSANQFKINGIDARSTYDAGRRTKIVHNSGGTTSYATVISAVFSTDTTVTVVVDGGTSLVSTITALSYALLDAANPSSPYKSVVSVSTTSGGTTLASNTAYVLLKNATPFPASAIDGDLYSEFSATTGNFTVANTGLYMVGAWASLNRNGASVTTTMFMQLESTTGFRLQTMTLDSLNESYIGVSMVGVFPVNAGDQLIASVSTPTFTGGPMKSANAASFFIRLR
jgi:hypothetical protein